MKSRQYVRRFVWILIVMLTGICFGLVDREQPNASRINSSQAVPYKILKDDMGNIISIGVQVDINEQQLRATLVKAANEHQDDVARDYVGFYLWVQAYLVVDGHQSNVRAGRLKRLIPFKSPAERKKMKANRTRSDRFEITLAAARQSLQ